MANWRRATLAIGLIGAAETWLHFLWPPFARYLGRSDHSVWKIVLELLKLPTNNIYTEIPGGGYLFLALAVPAIIVATYSIRSILSYFDDAFAPITILRTDWKLVFSEPSLARSRIIRKQIYFANRTGCTAYLLTTSVNGPNAEIVTDSITVTSSIDSENINLPGGPLKLGNVRTMKVIERFAEELPHSWIASILPNEVVLFLYERNIFFRRVLAERQAETEHTNEYNISFPLLSLSAPRFPVTLASVSIEFPTQADPGISSMKAYLLRDNLAKEIQFARDVGSAHVTYSLSVNKFRACALHIYWAAEGAETSYVAPPQPRPWWRFPKRPV